VDKALAAATKSKPSIRPVTAPKVKGAKNEALARKVQLIKLKQTAIGVKAVPFSERIHLHVIVPPTSGADRRELRYFVSNQWSVGKTVDYLTSENKIAHQSKGIQMVLSDDEDNTAGHFAYDLNLKQLQDEQRLFDGSTVYLLQLSRLT
jgi:hypothetical protein